MMLQAVVLVSWFLMAMATVGVVIVNLAKGNRARAYGLACMMAVLMASVTFGGTT